MFFILNTVLRIITNFLTFYRETKNLIHWQFRRLRQNAPIIPLLNKTMVEGSGTLLKSCA